jgi:class 3 adenylate cyclase
VHGYLTIAPGETRDIEPLPDGDILLRARGTSRSLTVARTTKGIVATVDADTIHTAGDAIADRMLRVRNDSKYPVRFQVERAGWEALRARGSLIVTIPGFADLFGTDAPAAGLPMEIGCVTVLFTDLVGSVDLYNRIGDARAFALVHEHWRDATIAIAARHGAVIKTLGDGVLAAFGDFRDGVAAALDVMAAAERLSRERDVAFAIRAGCHEGPCFVVRANDRIDLFGSTVNLAARLAGGASGQQLALVATSVEAVRETLEAAGCEIEVVTTKIRGLPGDFRLALATRGARNPVHTGSMRALPRLRTDPVA